MSTTPPWSSELEKTNLEVHVDMSRQRHLLLSEKMETIDERVDSLIQDLSDFRKEHTEHMIRMREERAVDSHNNMKVYIGAAATILSGIFGLGITLVIAFI